MKKLLQVNIRNMKSRAVLIATAITVALLIEGTVPAYVIRNIEAAQVGLDFYDDFRYTKDSHKVLLENHHKMVSVLVEEPARGLDPSIGLMSLGTIGSAVRVGEGVYVTAQHVVSESSLLRHKMFVLEWNGRAQIQGIKSIPGIDMALIYTDTKAEVSLRGLGLTGLDPLASMTDLEGRHAAEMMALRETPLFKLGFANGLPLHSSEGRLITGSIYDIPEEMHFYHTARLNPGDSGGGLFTRGGRLLGINVMLYKRSEPQSLLEPGPSLSRYGHATRASISVPISYITLIDARPLVTLEQLKLNAPKMSVIMSDLLGALGKTHIDKDAE